MHLYVLKRSSIALVFLCLMFALFATLAGPGAPALPAPAGPATYIVQAETSASAATAVEQAGGTITHQLEIINAVAAALAPATLAQLQANPQLSLHSNVSLRSADDDDDDDDDDDRETDTAGYELYPAAAVDVHTLRNRYVATPEIKCKNGRIDVKSKPNSQQLRGGGITVATIDSGLLPMDRSSDWKYRDYQTGTLIAENSYGRCIIYRDFVQPDNTSNSIDVNGHGTHVVATIGDNRETRLAPGMHETEVGVAPRTNLVIARALGGDGSGNYADVIAAIDWIVANKDTYAVRVLNLSLYAPVTGFYWQDPLNQAVMRAWQAGIVVVTVAGNGGPEPGSITAPGNVPYVITVGALTSGRYTGSGLDELADYSARGPTESAFVKPDVIVPASRTIAAMPNQSYLAARIGPAGIVSYQDVDLHIGRQDRDHAYYRLSGTSMAAAQVSGIVALMLQANPNLSPDQVKYRLLATARPAVDEVTGEPIYTVWEQGAGLVDAEQAIFGSTTQSANAMMDIGLDLDANHDEHHWGYTTRDETTGEFRLADPDTGEALEVWEGGRRSSAGGNWLWTSGRRSSAGNAETWAGGRRSSAGSTLTWAGNDMPWMQTGLQAPGGVGSNLVLERDIPPDLADERTQRSYVVWLPLINR